MKPTPTDIEDFIRQLFEDNYQALQAETSASLSAGAKQLALEQVLFYWRKLSDIANSVTETEVKLSLPNQVTPNGRPFTIEGVVDVVRDEHATLMYDIKTHAAEDIRAKLSDYEQQLNVYAHIWQGLRGRPLDGSAIIATRLPSGLRTALAGGNPDQIEQELARWQPVIDVPHNPDHVAATVADFARVVDAIEQGDFAPPPADVLRAPYGNSRQRFATLVCADCEARFSCPSYRAYAAGSNRSPDQGFAALYPTPDALSQAQEEWLAASLDAQAAIVP
jgi:hypothetical protein